MSDPALKRRAIVMMSLRDNVSIDLSDVTLSAIGAVNAALPTRTKADNIATIVDSRTGKLGEAEHHVAREQLFKQFKVPAELHIYAGTGHGFGLRANNPQPAGKWIERFEEWLAGSGFLKKP